MIKVVKYGGGCGKIKYKLNKYPLTILLSYGIMDISKIGGFVL